MNTNFSQVNNISLYYYKQVGTTELNTNNNQSNISSSSNNNNPSITPTKRVFTVSSEIKKKKVKQKNQLPLISFKQYLLNICDYLRGVGNISIRKSVINIPKLIVSKEKKTCFVCRYISDEIYKCKRVTKYCNYHFQYLH
ncbi:hypothetical protein ACTFIZ_012214 [Dictyostelium cf. discoideum]